MFQQFLHGNLPSFTLIEVHAVHQFTFNRSQRFTVDLLYTIVVRNKHGCETYYPDLSEIIIKLIVLYISLG